MAPEAPLGLPSVLLHILVQCALLARVLLRPHREPASRVAWVVVIVTIPVMGIIAYLLLGEIHMGRRRVKRMRQIFQRLPITTVADEKDSARLPEVYKHLFDVGKTVNGFSPVGGNQASLMPDSNATIAALVTDIDRATAHVHLTFYIWLPDHNGCLVAEALKRAAARGVICRAMADSLGSRIMIDSEHWQAMRNAGVHLAIALPIGNPLLRPLKRRIDLRNHRKIVIIDNLITYCGSQNCADPEFRLKARYAPWVDAVMRFEGPIAHQNQYLFASDWEAETSESLAELINPVPLPTHAGILAQVIGTGPTIRYSAMPEMFETLMYAARRELLITTPYYVPDESMQAALCACARRGVDTRLILPARNDSWFVAAASRSYYADLLSAGVQIFEYEGGLLHSKSLTLDGDITLIGSANMDRRSFELNFENNVLLYDPALTSTMRQRQADYIASSRLISSNDIRRWPWYHRLWNNAIAMLGPVL